jgi:hypothetical protein
MDTKDSLASLPRWSMYLVAAAFGLLGLVLYLAPSWSAANFSWKISPMIAMTMGGWYLGSAVMAGLVAYHRRWSEIYIGALYVGFFSLAESIVLLVHQSKLNLDALLAWPYIGMLSLGLIASLFMLSDWARKRPIWFPPDDRPVPRWVQLSFVFFILLVFFLAGVAFSGHWVGLNGGVFPEPLTLFTLRAFGAFYFSLGLAAIAFLFKPRWAASTLFVRAGLALIVLITTAALVYFSVFDIAHRRFQSIYLGVYFAAFIWALFYLWAENRHRAVDYAPSKAGGKEMI